MRRCCRALSLRFALNSVPGQSLQNALLQIAHDLLLQTKSQLAIAANASSIHVIQRDMNRAIWNIATAIDHLAEFAQPSQDTVKVIERLMLFVGSSPSPEGQQLAAEASAVLGMSEGVGMKPMIQVIQAHLVERDQFGFWTHPNYPDLADNCSSNEAQETLRRLGLELQNVFMESDAPRLYDSARSDQRYSEWIPTRPEGAGWFVLSIHDTDNGPVCQYVRPLGEHLSPIDLDAAAEQHERLLSEACAKALIQRDVALARVASLESKLAELEKPKPAAPAPAALPPFAEKVLAKLHRFYDCVSDFESGGVDIGRHWLDLLTQLGLLNRVQRSPALWEITQQGEDLLGTSQPSPAPELVERGTQHRFSTTEQTCRHDFYGVWWNDSGVTKTGRECRHCGLFVTDMTEAAAEQAGGDERVAFEEAASELGIYTCNFERYTEETAAHENRINARVEDPVRVGDYRSATLQDCWKVWQEARAALARPEWTSSKPAIERLDRSATEQGSTCCNGGA